MPSLPPLPRVPKLPADHPLAKLRHVANALRDRFDSRDQIYQPADGASLPAQIDLRPQCPPIYNQGELAACTANAVAAALQFYRAKHAQTPDFVPSRLYLYYYERATEGDPEVDAGASTRDAIRVAKAKGSPPEALWPYDSVAAEPPGGSFPAGARASQAPPPELDEIAALYKATAYLRVKREQMKACLAEGYPFTLGIVIYPGFVDDQHHQPAVTPIPAITAEPIGEHVVLAVGYDDTQQWWICRNSWGPDQGDQGYFYLPYAYADQVPTRLGDCWTLRTVAD